MTTRDRLKAGGIVFGLKRDLRSGGLCFDADGNLRIFTPGMVTGMRLTRRDARLLAKRINQALDYWRDNR